VTTWLDQVERQIEAAQSVALVTSDPWRRSAIVSATANVVSALHDDPQLLRLGYGWQWASGHVYGQNAISVTNRLTFAAANGRAWLARVESKQRLLAEALEPVAPQWAEVVESSADQAATAIEQTDVVMDPDELTSVPLWAKGLAAAIAVVLLYRLSGR
jgi:hypothetical protein